MKRTQPQLHVTIPSGLDRKLVFWGIGGINIVKGYSKIWYRSPERHPCLMDGWLEVSVSEKVVKSSLPWLPKSPTQSYNENLCMMPILPLSDSISKLQVPNANANAISHASASANSIASASASPSAWQAYCVHLLGELLSHLHFQTHLLECWCPRPDNPLASTDLGCKFSIVKCYTISYGSLLKNSRLRRILLIKSRPTFRMPLWFSH